MTDIKKMIREADRAYYLNRDPEMFADMKAALSTIAPLELLAGVKAGTHVIAPVNFLSENPEAMIAARPTGGGDE